MEKSDKKTPLSFKAKKSVKSTPTSTKDQWLVMIADDESQVHEMTKLVLSDFSFLGKKIKFVSAFSGKETKELINLHPDVKLILLDVVMEDDDTGLEVVKYIREELKNDLVRIILRTGQPGQAPEEKVIFEYDINDYKTKSELTDKKLSTAIVTSLRNFQGLMKLKETEEELRKINKALLNEMEERKHTELALIESEERFRSLTTSAPVGISLADPKGRCIYTNKHWRNITGHSFTEDLGHQWDQMIHPEDRELVTQKWSNSISENNKFSDEFRILNQQKEERWISFHSTTLGLKNGKLDSYVNIMVDITERKKHEIEILEKVRMEGELKTAAAVQRHLFPEEVPQIKNMELTAYFQSASETGGDWYGFMTKFDNYLYIMIGDVTGHGIPAALVTATVSGSCRLLEEIYHIQYKLNQVALSPADCLKYLNTAVFEMGHPEFLMTFFMARIDLRTGLVIFSNAGHNFPVVVHADGQISYLLNSNSTLGFSRECNFIEDYYQLKENDTLIFFTDGLIENESPEGDMWGQRKFRQFIQKNHTLPTGEFVNKLVKEAYLFYSDNPIDDDLTIVTCKNKKAF